MYWRRSVTRVAVAIASVAALSKVAISNGHCTGYSVLCRFALLEDPVSYYKKQKDRWKNVLMTRPDSGLGWPSSLSCPVGSGVSLPPSMFLFSRLLIERWKVTKFDEAGAISGLDVNLRVSGVSAWWQRPVINFLTTSGCIFLNLDSETAFFSFK